MHLLIIVLNKEMFLDEVMEAFVEVGITGATIVDSVGMGQTLAYKIPIFAGLRKSINTSECNKMIFSVVQNEKILEEAIQLIEEIIDFSTPGNGILFVVPITMTRGIGLDELKW